MNERVRKYLIEVARKKSTCYYQKLSDDCKLGLIMQESEFARAEIGRILGEISVFEHENKRPLLSALVISRTGEQGDGFFKLAEELGYGSWKKLKAEMTFEMGQIRKCHEFWGKEENYAKYR